MWHIESATFHQTEPFIMETPLKFSTVNKPAVTHVGTMNPDKRNNNNFEGVGLCVSECPNDWVRICKLGGLPRFNLAKANSIFASYLSVNKASLTHWANKNGFIQTQPVYRVYFIDCETGIESYISTECRETAQVEAEAQESKICEGVMHIPTDKLNDHFCISVPKDNALEYSFQLYVEKYYPEVDGVWFDYENDGDYSAPSGLIFDKSLLNWSPEEVNVNPAKPQSTPV